MVLVPAKRDVESVVVSTGVGVGVERLKHILDKYIRKIVESPQLLEKISKSVLAIKMRSVAGAHALIIMKNFSGNMVTRERNKKSASLTRMVSSLPNEDLFEDNTGNKSSKILLYLLICSLY